MAISQFPAPSAGGAGGTGLPEGAVALEFGGKLTANGYTHSATLAAGKYIINTDGNQVKVTLGDNAKEYFIASGETIDIPLAESNFSMVPTVVKAGPQVEHLTLPVAMGPFTGYARQRYTYFNEYHGTSAMFAGRYNSDNAVYAFPRRENGAWNTYPGKNNTVQSFTANSGVYRTGGVVDSAGNIFGIGNVNTTQIRVYKWNAAGTLTLSYINSVDLTNFPSNGLSGAAISQDDQTIVAPFYSSNFALVSTDGGSTWTDVALPGTPYTANNQYTFPIRNRGGRFIIPTTNSGQFMHSTDGLTWILSAIPGAAGTVTGYATDGNGNWIFGTNSTANTIWTTTDFTSFVPVSVTGSTTAYWSQIAYGGGKWLLSNWQVDNNTVTMAMSSDGTNWTVIDSDPQSYGNATYGTNLGEYSPTNYRYVDFDTYGSGLWWDEQFNQFFQQTHVYDQNSTAVARAGISIDPETYLRWAWATGSTTSDYDYASHADNVIYHQAGNKWYYGLYYADRNAYGSLLHEYDVATTKVKTISLGYNGNGQFLHQGNTTGHLTGGIDTTRFVLVGNNSVMYSDDFTTAVVPSWTSLYGFTAGGYPSKAVQWPDGSLNLFSEVNNTTYVPSIGLKNTSFWRWNWSGGTQYYENNIYSQWINNSYGAISLDTVAGTYYLAAINYTHSFQAYPLTSANAGMTNNNGNITAEMTFGDYSAVQYTSADAKAGLNISVNGGDSLANVPDFKDFNFQQLFVIDGIWFFVWNGNYYKVNDFLTGDYERITDGFNRITWAGTNSGLWHPDMNDITDPYMIHRGTIYKAFGGSYTPDVNVFVYNANQEEL